MSREDKIAKMLGQLSPEAQTIARDYAKLKVEVKMLKQALSASQQQYAHLFMFILAILRGMPEGKIAFKAKDLEAYSQFKDHWVLQSRYVAETDEQVLYLALKGKEATDEKAGESTDSPSDTRSVE